MRDQTLTFNATALKEYLDAYDRTAELAGVTVARKLSKEWTVSGGVSSEFAVITQEDVTRDYTLLQVPLTTTFDNTGSLSTRRTAGAPPSTVTPTQSFRSPGATFVIAQATGSTYLISARPAGACSRSARWSVGRRRLHVRDPPDQRFYAGGTSTVRGYTDRTDLTAFSRRPPDRRHLDRRRHGRVQAALRRELRRGRVRRCGQVGDRQHAVQRADPRRRRRRRALYTSIGPIRLDIGVPLQKIPKNNILQAYIGLGQAF